MTGTLTGTITGTTTSTMRYFSVQQLLIDTQLPLLFHDDDEITIEPKLHQLLLYFCRQPNIIISRDQIIQDINQGVVVSDNAVNKMVANLRQLLNDNPKQPQFIKTIPKQGYCFIATVTPQENINNPKQAASNSTQSKKSIWSIAALVCAVLVLLIVIFNNNKNTTHRPQINKLVPLTRHLGVEFAPAISPDGRYLAYTRNDPVNNISQLWLKNLNNKAPEQMLASVPDSAEMAWSSTSDKLIYTDYSDQHCRFVLVAFKQGKAQPPAPITDCNALYIPQMLFVDNDQRLYFVARVNGLEPMRIFSLDLKDNTRQLVNQPELIGEGNYSIDMTDDGQKLLILSTDEQFQTTLNVLDRQSNELTRKGSWDRRLNRAIWHHDNQSIVHTSNQYSHELVQSDVWGEQLSTIASTSNRVAENYRRHPNGRDFYFSSFMMNNDNLILDVSNSQKTTNFNSGVYDKLPTFGPTTEQWYFASKRNGITQIFSAKEKDQQLKQLSNYQEEPDLNSLDVSPDGQKLLVLGTTHVTLMTIEGEELKTVNVPAGLVMASHWLSDTLIAASVLRNEVPQLYTYDLNEQAIAQDEPKWQAAFASPSGKRWFYIDKLTDVIFEWDKTNQQLIDTGIKPPEIYGAGLNVKATETALVYIKQTRAVNQLISVDLKTKQTNVLGEWLFVAGFDVLQSAIVLSYEHSRFGDVMMTQF